MRFTVWADTTLPYRIAGSPIRLAVSTNWTESHYCFGSPAYLTLTSLLMPFLGVSDVTARLVPALFGLGLVMLPWLLRDRLGQIGALLAAALFAVSPLYAAISRTAGGDAIALFAILLVTVASLRLRDGGSDIWLYTLAGALGLGLASSPLIYSGLITLAIAWFAQRLVSSGTGV